MNNGELNQIKKDSTTFVDELKDKVHDQHEEIKRLNSIINNDFSKICREKMIDKLSANEMILLQDKEIERLNNIINDIDTYIHLWKLEEIGEKTMLILNDILLIKNGMSDEVIRLKGSDK